VNRLQALDRHLRQLRPKSGEFWLVCLPPALFIAAVVFMKEWPRLHAATAGSDGTATIVSRNCERDEFSYEFAPSPGEVVTGRARASRAGRPCASLVAGATVPVRYTTTGRAAHVVGADPVTYERTRMLLIPLFGLAGLLGIAFVLIAFHEPDGSPRKR